MSKPEKPGELQDVTVDAISLVTKAANGERFKVFKSADNTEGKEPEPTTTAYVEAMKKRHDEPKAPDDVQKDDRGLLNSVCSVFKAILGVSDGDVVQKGETPGETRAPAVEVEAEKSGRKISGPRLNKLKEMYAILGRLIEETDSESEGESEVNKEDITKVVKESLDEALKPISDRLDKLEKAEADPEEPQEAPKDAEPGEGTPNVGEVVKAALEEALAPFTERLEKVEKARGFSNRVPEETVQKDGGDFWGGLF